MTKHFAEDVRKGRGSRHSIVAREAAQWLVVLPDAECTREEREEFIAWLRRSNLHVEEFLRISELTGSLVRFKFWPDDPVADLIAQARAGNSGAVVHIRAASGRAAESGRAVQRRLWRPSLAVVASLATISLAVGVIAGMFDWGSKTYATNAGEIRSITLEDGSVAELNTRSRLRARFTANERRVQLIAGEAIFNVAKNPGRPFRVSAGSTEIVAVGTQFNVDAHDSSTVVTVLEGRVRVTSKPDIPPRDAGRFSPPVDHQIELARGEQAIVAKHRPPLRVAAADTARATAWTERRLFFERATLRDVATEFARYNDRIIRINGDVLAVKRISGVFNATDQPTFIEFLRTHTDVRVREDARGWVLEPGASQSDVGGPER
ncbi:MAG: FecR family protein [Steroidobacteraceae bacterium]